MVEQSDVQVNVPGKKFSTMEGLLGFAKDIMDGPHYASLAGISTGAKADGVMDAEKLHSRAKPLLDHEFYVKLCSVVAAPSSLKQSLSQAKQLDSEINPSKAEAAA